MGPLTLLNRDSKSGNRAVFPCKAQKSNFSRAQLTARCRRAGAWAHSRLLRRIRRTLQGVDNRVRQNAIAADFDFTGWGPVQLPKPGAGPSGSPGFGLSLQARDAGGHFAGLDANEDAGEHR